MQYFSKLVSFGDRNDSINYDFVLWQNIPVAIKKENLEIGDFMIKSPDKNIVFIFERKTITDWAQSMKDGRYREQKTRLRAFYNQWIAAKGFKPMIFYIIEGSLDSNEIISPIDINEDAENGDNNISGKGEGEREGDVEYQTRVAGIPLSTLWSSFYHTIIRDNIFIIQTTTAKHTAHALLKSLETMAKYEANVVDNCRMNPSTATAAEYNEEYWEGVQINKGKNLTPDIVYRKMLCQIPKVSKKTCDAIVERYPNMRILMEEYQGKETVGEKEQMLANIVIESANDEHNHEQDQDQELKTKKRNKRIGKELSKKVYQYLFNN
jgi:ERCC4-type nuclease